MTRRARIGSPPSSTRPGSCRRRRTRSFGFRDGDRSVGALGGCGCSAGSDPPVRRAHGPSAYMGRGRGDRVCVRHAGLLSRQGFRPAADAPSRRVGWRWAGWLAGGRFHFTFPIFAFPWKYRDDFPKLRFPWKPRWVFGRVLFPWKQGLAFTISFAWKLGWEWGGSFPTFAFHIFTISICGPGRDVQDRHGVLRRGRERNRAGGRVHGIRHGVRDAHFRNSQAGDR